MSARASASGSISFGMVSVPVKYYTAASSESVKFRMITPKGNPIKQKYVDPVDGEEYSFKDCHKGFEYEKGKFVMFSPEEIKALESEGNKGCVEIEQFVPIETIDLVHVEQSYYIKPDKGGDKAFKLLASAMEAKSKAAVGQWTNRGKDHLVVIRPYKGGMILHTLYYQNEVRDYDDNVAVLPVSDVEKDLAGKLIDQLTVAAFNPDHYHDKYTQRVMDAVEKKKANPNEQITVSDGPKAPALDLFAALTASLGDVKSGVNVNDKTKVDKPVKKTQRKKAAKKAAKK
jgi:DNA end-binding protein Ku